MNATRRADASASALPGSARGLRTAASAAEGARRFEAGDPPSKAASVACPAAAALRPAVCFGAVMHERHVQAHNRILTIR